MAAQIYFHSYDSCTYKDENGDCIQTREELDAYDPDIKAILDDLYPCQNEFIHRCDENQEIPSGRCG